MIVTLFSGVILITTMFFIIKRLTGFLSNSVGAIVAIITLVIFMPLAIIYWPGGDVFAIHLAIYMITVYGLAIISSHHDKNSKVHWAPVAIISFFVLLVFVDSFFVTIADKGLSSQVADLVLPKSDDDSKATFNYPGKVVHDFHQKENLYNDYLDQIEARKRSNWKIKKGWLTLPIVNKDAIFQVQIHDKHNKSVIDANITGKFIRFSDSRLDKSFSMRYLDDGMYQVKIQLSEPGRWGLVLKIEHENTTYKLNGSTAVSLPNKQNLEK